MAFQHPMDVHQPVRPAMHAPVDHGKAPLRICLLGYRSHPHVGGQGIYLHYLSKALVDLGHQVDVISGPPYPELDPRVALIRLPSLDLYAIDNPIRALRWHHLRSFTDTYEWWAKLTGAFAEPYTFGRRLVKYFRNHADSYDLIHDNQSLCHGLLQLQEQGLPVVATLHHPITRDRDLALAAAGSAGHRWLIRRWYGFLAMQAEVTRKLRHVITVSECSRRDIAQAFGRPVEQTHVIPNGVDIGIFRPLPGIARDPLRLITTASSDQPLKGLSQLLRALARLRETWPQLTLRVIGPLKAGGATERELDKLQLRACVTFVSGISREQLVEEYAGASIAVVPSLYEGFGLPAAEAMACGLPLVCSDGGALPEVVGGSAQVYSAGNEDELTQALASLLADAPMRTQLGLAGLTRVRQLFSWEEVARQLTEYYYTRVLKTPDGVDPPPFELSCADH